MKQLGIATLALSAAIAASANAQSTVTYGPILGYCKTDIPAGNSTWVCGFVKKKDHQGAMDALTSGATSVITENDRDFAVNEFATGTGGVPSHFVEILETGAAEGLVLDIVSNTQNTITVDGDLSGFGLSGSEAFCIREHVTLGDLFPDGGATDTNNGFQGTDLLFFFESDGSTPLFTFGGTSWTDGGGSPADDKVVYPGQGFLVVASAAREILMGRNGVTHVKETPTMVPIYHDIVNLVGGINPVVGKNHRLGDLGIGDSLTFRQFVIPFTQDGSLTETGFFTTDGSGNVIDGGGSNSNLFETPVLNSFLVFSSEDPANPGSIVYYRQPGVDGSILQNP